MYRNIKSFAVHFIIIVMVSLLPFDGYGQAEEGTGRFDPFLQRELRQDGYLGLLRDAQPGISSPALGKIRETVGPLYDVVIFGDDDALSSPDLHLNTQIPGIATARVTLYDLAKLGYQPGIRRIEMGGSMSVNVDRGRRNIKADRVNRGDVMNIPFLGEDVILGIIDTGIDIFHPDFRDTLDQNKTRVHSIWHVGLDPQSGEQHPAGKNYGVEYTREQIERELRGETNGFIRARDTDGHGTHVAGIAGGNGARANGQYVGVAPAAEFIIVQVPATGISTASVIDGMDYIFTVAEGLGRPAVVNMSFGGHGGSHDGTAGHEQAINFYSQMRSRAIVAAAGNSGDAFNHQGGTLGPGGESVFTLNVPVYTPDVNGENYVLQMLWYAADDDVEVTVTSPNGFQVSASSGDSVAALTNDGTIEIDTFDDYTNPKGARLFLIDIYDNTALFPPRAGNWEIKVTNTSGSADVTFNSWIVTSSMDWPEYFPNTGRGYTLNMPGTAEGAITVGSHVTRQQWTSRSGQTWHFPGVTVGTLSGFSSGGPTRDERMKPNLTAPGQIIASTQSQLATFQEALLLPEEGYVLLQGTSMAAPHITGAVALIFEANPDLTGMQVIEILEASALGDPFTQMTPNFEWGHGKADILRAFDYFEITGGVPDEYYLFQNYPNPFNSTTSISFTIPEPTRGKVVVYDILGRRVAVLYEGAFEPRLYTLTFRGANRSSGVYFYRLETDTFTEVKKMVLVK
jgi:minor extracellular serine protease Vpr